MNRPTNADQTAWLRQRTRHPAGGSANALYDDPNTPQCSRRVLERQERREARRVLREWEGSR